MSFLWRAVCLLACSLAVTAQQIEWTIPLDAPASAPTLFPNESKPTALAFTANKSVYLVDGNGTVRWTKSFEDFVASPVTVANIRDDDAPELEFLLANGTVICLNSAGDEVWRRDFATPAGGFKHVVAADLLEAQGLELLIGFEDGWLNCIGAQGEVLWRFMGDRGRVGGIAVADVVGDEAPEIVYGTDNGNIYCLNAYGRVVWRYEEIAPYGRSGPNIADVDDDGKPEVYITRSNVGNATCLMALDAATGQYLWRSKDIQQGYVSNAFADVDGDGALNILHGDKGNFLYCENADGSRRWQTELGGRGLFWAPAIADVDGDDKLEIIAGMRGADPETGASVFVVGADGAIEAAINTGSSANASPCVGDVDGDGQLELIVMGEGPNQVICYAWGKTGYVAWPSIRGNSAMTASSSVWTGSPMPESLSTTSGVSKYEKKKAYLGENSWTIPIDPPAAKAGFMEFSVRSNSHTAEHRIVPVKPGDDNAHVNWNLAHADTSVVEARLFEDAQSRYLMKARVTPLPLTAGMAVVTQGELHATPLIESRAHAIEAGKDRLKNLRASGTSGESLAETATTLRLEADQVAHLSDIVARFGSDSPFVLTHDTNPWNAFESDRAWDSGTEPSEGPVRLTAHQNEFEDVALTIFNLGTAALDIRCQFFEPGSGQGRPAGDPELARRVTLRRLVPVQAASGETVWDALPELDHSRTITVPSGESRQLWLTVDTHGLEAGTHNLTLFLRPLGITATTREVPIEITVWPVALPQTVYRQMNWSRFDPNDASDQAVRDMIDHGINVIYGPPLPTVPVDTKGARAGDVDWSAFDAIMERVPKHFFLLWGAPAPLKWPGDAPAEGSDVHIAGLRAAIHEMNRHLAPMGYSYDQWAFYPMDEPWNTGLEGIPQLKAFCERIKRAEPLAQIYTDPAGATRVEYVEEFKHLIDVWQPEMNILKRDPALVAWFREHAKHFWAYEATGPAKQLLPLGYYRAYAWLAWSLGTEGAGYWVYRGEDTWWPVQGGDWSAVYQTNELVVPSRRWQASRDGVEDYRAFYLLREEAAKARTAGNTAAADQADALLAEAVEKVVGWQIGTIDEITRHTREYEIDYNLLLDFRKQIAERIIALRQ